MTQQNTAAIDITFGEGSGVMVKAAVWKVGAHGFVPRSGLNILKKQMFLPPPPLTPNGLVLCEASVTER